MAEFFDNTWILWWVLAVFAILRWSFAMSADSDLDHALARYDASRSERNQT